jgi:hypothetical protein
VLEKQPGLSGMFLRATDALSNTHHFQNEPLSRTIKNIRDPYTGQIIKQQVLVAGIQAVSKLIPNLDTAIASVITKTNKVPLEGISCLSDFNGGENTSFLVYQLDREGKNNKVGVLKINKFSIGQSPEILLEIATRLRSEYKKISECYHELPNLIPQEDTFIGHSHLGYKPAVLTLSKYIPGDKRGIFEDYTQEELIQLFKEDEDLGNQFRTFGGILLKEYEERQWCIDILGKRNMSINEHNGRRNLLLVDPHIIYNPERLKQDPPKKTEHLENRINTIRRVHSSLS